MSRPPKRSWRDVVDLTGEASDGEPPSQTRRLHNGSSKSTQMSTQTVEPEGVDLTQEDDGPVRELYGTFGTYPKTCRTLCSPNADGKIVGVRYYNGRVSPGELVLCIREPHNQVWQATHIDIHC
jgi:SWI/SNF-related matrix-associated actin-dependent regulator of chromatin subfamily A3